MTSLADQVGVSKSIKRLTKEDILEGASRRETLVIKDYNAEVVIRPLTDGELSKIFAAIGPIPLMPDGTPDTSKIELDKNFEVLKLAASLGLVDPRLSLEELANMKFGVPEYVGMAVLEMSGAGPPETVKKKDGK